MPLAWPDIIKTMLGGIGGYGIRFVQAENRKRRMRRQLYREISRNNQHIVVRIAVATSYTGLAQGLPLRFAEGLDISFDVWNFYNDDKRRSFLFELKEADAISRIYAKVGNIGNEAASSGYQLVRAKEAAAEVDERLLDGSLKKRIYKRESTKEAWAFMADLLNGKRESYRKALGL